MRSEQRFRGGRQEHRPIHEHDEHSLPSEAAAVIGRPGHNASLHRASQWQEPTTSEMAGSQPRNHDLDLVEQEFYRSALSSSDPTSLLRLARVPFIADIGGGKLMRLLSISVADEIELERSPPLMGRRCRVSPSPGIPREALTKFAFRIPHPGRDPGLQLRRDTRLARPRLSTSAIKPRP